MGDSHRPQGLLRRDHRRLQPVARRARSAGCWSACSRTWPAPTSRPAYKDGVALMVFLVVILFRPEGPARPRPRSARFERTIALLVAGDRPLALLAPLVLKNYGIYLLTLWCVYVIAGMGLNLTVGYAGQMSHRARRVPRHRRLHRGDPDEGGRSLLARPAAWPRSAASSSAWRSASRRCACSTTTSPSPRSGFNVAGVPRDAQRGMAHRRHLRHHRHPAADALRPFARRPGGLLLLHLGIDARAGAACCGGCLRSPWGRAFTALRDNPIRAESLGVDIKAYTLLAFAIGAAYAGIAGALVRGAGAVHRAGAVPSRGLAHDAPDGDRRRRGPLLRPDARRGASGVLLPEWLRFMQDWYLVRLRPRRSWC